MGQESDRVQEWSKRLESIQSEIRLVASELKKKGRSFDESEEEPRKLYDEIRELDDELDTLRDKARAIYNEIWESREMLDGEEYERVYAEYQATFKTYRAARDEYKSAYEVYQTAKHKTSHSARGREASARRSSGSVSQRNAQLAQELDGMKAAVAFTEGSEVIALRTTEMKSGPKTVGHIQKGERFTVAKVQGPWLWTGKGWVNARNVISAALRDWYERLPDNSRISVGDKMYGKYKDVFFETVGQGGGIAFVDNSMTINGKRMSHPVLVIGKEMTFALDNRGGRWLLSVAFTHFDSVSLFRTLPVVEKAVRPYASVGPGAFVRIDAKQQRVYVDGQPIGSR